MKEKNRPPGNVYPGPSPDTEIEAWSLSRS